MFETPLRVFGADQLLSSPLRTSAFIGLAYHLEVVDIARTGRLRCDHPKDRNITYKMLILHAICTSLMSEAPKCKAVPAHIYSLRGDIPGSLAARSCATS